MTETEKPKVFFGISEEQMRSFEARRAMDLGLFPKNHLELLVEAMEWIDPEVKISHELAAKYQPGGKCSCGKAIAGECDVCNRPCPVCGKKMVVGKCLHWRREDHQ